MISCDTFEAINLCWEFFLLYLIVNSKYLIKILKVKDILLWTGVLSSCDKVHKALDLYLFCIFIFDRYFYSVISLTINKIASSSPNWTSEVRISYSFFSYFCSPILLYKPDKLSSRFEILSDVSKWVWFFNRERLWFWFVEVLNVLLLNWEVKLLKWWFLIEVSPTFVKRLVPETKELVLLFFVILDFDKYIGL